MRKTQDFDITQAAPYIPPPYVEHSSVLDGVKPGSVLKITTGAGREDYFTVAQMQRVIDTQPKAVDSVPPMFYQEEGGASINTTDRPERVIHPIGAFDEEVSLSTLLKLERKGKYYDVSVYNGRFYIWPAHAIPGLDERYQIEKIEKMGSNHLVKLLLVRLGRILH